MPSHQRVLDEVAKGDEASEKPVSPATTVIATTQDKLPTDNELPSLVCSMDPVAGVADEEPPEKATERELSALHSTHRKVYRTLLLLVSMVLVWFLSFAQAVLIPLVMSVVLYLLLRPAVRWLNRRRVPETLAAIICLSVVVLTLVLGILPLIGPAQSWLEHLPEHLRNADQKLAVVREHLGQFSQIREKLASLAGSEKGEEPIRVAVQEGELASSTTLVTVTGSTLGMLLIVIVLTFFLLIAGDQLLNHILSLLPTFREKRQTVELILDIQRGISAYLVTITMINAGLGVAIAAALTVMGVPNAAMWGLLTSVFNYVPFVGQGVAGLIISLVALLTFDSVGYALLVPVVFYTIAAIEGNVITPALVGKHLSLNPIIVLVALLFWGWIWGIAGAALAVPILAMMKIGCDRFECTRPVGTLLGG